MRTIEEYMRLPYRMEIVPDTVEGGFAVRFPMRHANRLKLMRITADTSKSKTSIFGVLKIKKTCCFHLISTMSQ